MFAGILRRTEKAPEPSFERGDLVYVKNKNGELESGWRVALIDHEQGVALVDKPRGSEAQRRRDERFGRPPAVVPMEVALNDLIQWQEAAEQDKKIRVVK